MSTTGGEDERCPCTNATGTLASLSERHCLLPSGDVGVHLTLGGSCVPFSYGSSHCLRHDLLHDPACSSNDALVYCLRTWCYVDPVTCKRDSEHRLFRSSYFSHESEIDLFFSYSACNATADEWYAVEDELAGNALGGASILATTPTYIKPMMYKRDIVTGEILTSPGSEYYDDSVPYEGVYSTYVNRLVEISNGDIQNINITHKSKASSLVHPQSSATAAVQDIQDGLVDMAIGPFWITGERLRMASFTIPILNDQTFLVIPRPGKEDTLGDQALKVAAPFSPDLWGLLFGIIVVTSLLSVWFSDRSSTDVTAQTDRRAGLARNGSQRKRRRKRAYARLALDSFLQKGLFFCSAGVEQEDGGTLPNQLLMFGFGAFILVAVSAYVANLAAFLTLSSAEAPIKTMADAVKSGVAICAHPALKAELKVAWPDANFYFHMEGREFAGMLEDYKNKKCRVMAVGWEDTSLDTGFLENLCKENLVYTDSLVIQTPVAFPIRPALASGISYWIHQGKSYHETSIEQVKEEYAEKISCDIHFSDVDTEASELEPIQAKNMLFPLTIFGACLVLAVLTQLWHQHNLKKGKESLVGRVSTLSLTANCDSSNGMGSRIRRRKSSSPKEDKDDEGRDGGEKVEGEEFHQNRMPARSWSIMAGMMVSGDKSDAEISEN